MLGNVCIAAPRMLLFANADCPRPAAAPRPHLHRARVMSASAGGDYVQMIGEKNAANAVVVYSKTYCPCEQLQSYAAPAILSPRLPEQAFEPVPTPCRASVCITADELINRWQHVLPMLQTARR